CRGFILLRPTLHRLARMSVEGEVRPWGSFEVVDQGEGFRVKRIIVHPGHRLSYQRHRSRSEHWYVISGLGVVLLDDAESQIGPGKTVEIPIGTAHRVAAIGHDDLVFIEIQTGSYFGED